jgi:phage terminase large subunit-like protein
MSARQIGLLEACDDPRLFNFELWPKQREMLRAVERAFRIHVWAVGRRSGKTTIAALVCLWDALLRPELDAMVRPGERRFAVAVAVNQAQARVLLAAARSIVERSPVLAGLLEGATEDRLEFTLPSGARTAVAAFPCTSRGARGWPISCLVLDEYAHHVSPEDGEGGHQTAERLWQAMVPATAQFREHARVLALSTPFGSTGTFSTLFQQASSGELPDATAFQLPTRAVNPTVDAAFLEREERRDPDGFAQEYGAQFLAGGAAYLDLERATIADRAELRPDDVTHCVAGLDPSFSSDPLGLSIVGRPHDPAQRNRLRLALTRAWAPPRKKADSFEERRAIEDAVLDEVAAVCKRYRVWRVVTDQYMSRSVVDRLQRHGLAVRIETLTASSKTEAFGELRARLYDQTLELYRDPDLLAELKRLRTKFSAGSSSVVTPRVGRSHCDQAVSLALAVLEQSRAGYVGERRKSGFGDYVDSGQQAAAREQLIYRPRKFGRMGGF